MWTHNCRAFREWSRFFFFFTVMLYSNFNSLFFHLLLKHQIAWAKTPTESRNPRVCSTMRVHLSGQLMRCDEQICFVSHILLRMRSWQITLSHLTYGDYHTFVVFFISSNIIPSLSNIALQSYTLYCTANFSVRLFVRPNHSLSQTQIQFIALHWGKERKWTRQGERDR